jgi:hypothetical protein
MREQKQRDKEEEKRRQEAAELKWADWDFLRNKCTYFLLEITLHSCKMTRWNRIR